MWRHRSQHSDDVVRSTRRRPAVKRPMRSESSLCFLRPDSAVSCTPVFRVCIIVTEHRMELSINQLFNVAFCLVCRLMSPHCNAWWQEHAHRHGHPNMPDLNTNLISRDETSRRTVCSLSLALTSQFKSSLQNGYWAAPNAVLFWSLVGSFFIQKGSHTQAFYKCSYNKRSGTDYILEVSLRHSENILICAMIFIW